MFMKGFSDIQRTRLTIATYLMISSGLVPPTCLSKIMNEHLIKDGIALEFARCFFATWLKEKDFQSLISNLKKAELDGKLLVRILNFSFRKFGGLTILLVLVHFTVNHFVKKH